MRPMTSQPSHGKETTVNEFLELRTAIADWLAVAGVESASLVMVFPAASRRSAVLPFDAAAEASAIEPVARRRVSRAVRAFAAIAFPEAIDAYLTSLPHGPRRLLTVAIAGVDRPDDLAHRNGRLVA
jgi:hypothetical protein